MKLYYNPLDRACKSLVGPFARGSAVTFAIYDQPSGEDAFSADSCVLVLHGDGCPEEEYPMRRTEKGAALTLRFHEVGLYFYHFRVGEQRFGCGRLRKGEFGAEGEWQITVYEEDYQTPDWFKGGVMYQIFPDRFAKKGETPLGEHKIMREWGDTPYFRPNEFGQVLNNDFFGGNLNGIREKLDYLADLGVTAIYLNPIFEAFSNHRYDTGDYLKIDGLLGTVGDFDALIEDAGKRGIKIILDGVFNHTGADSRYFNLYGRYPTLGAYQSADSPYADWYCFHPFPDEYDCWWGIRTLPAVNECSPSYQEFILGENGVLKTWLRHGIGGYRLDVADELPDFFLKKLRKAVKEENGDALILGEVWEDASNKISYDVRREYFQGGELDGVMNYPLKDAIIDYLTTGNSARLRETIFALLDNYPTMALHSAMNILGTHDTVRILTVLGGKHCGSKEEMAAARLTEEEKARAKTLLRMAAVLQYTLPGVPCVYYGDEICMEGYADPFCRRCFDWEHPDCEMLSFYQKLGAIRRELNEAFRTGEYREIFADFSCLVYARTSGAQTVYVYINRANSEYKISFDGAYTELLTDATFCGQLVIGPLSCGILTKKKAR